MRNASIAVRPKPEIKGSESSSATLHSGKRSSAHAREPHTDLNLIQVSRVCVRSRTLAWPLVSSSLINTSALFTLRMYCARRWNRYQPFSRPVPRRRSAANLDPREENRRIEGTSTPWTGLGRSVSI